MRKAIKKLLSVCLAGTMVVGSMFGQGGTVSPTVTALAAVKETSREDLETALYNFDYYVMANPDVANTYKYDTEKVYKHWISIGIAEGRIASLIFDAKYYLEVNPSVKSLIGNNYAAAYEHFVTTGLKSGLESSPVFDVKYYLQENPDIAAKVDNDYVRAAIYFNQNALTDNRVASSRFDIAVYKKCNTDVADLYGKNTVGYYLHYINYGRAEGRTTGGTTGIGDNVAAYRIFDADFYLGKYPELAQTVGTDKNKLYDYWITQGVALGQSASPVFDPQQYLTLNPDVA